MMKEFKIQVPEGYKIDTENSTFECIKFMPIENITYKDVCDELFENNLGWAISSSGELSWYDVSINKYDVNNAPTSKQLEKLLALNQLLNIAYYYNSKINIDVPKPYYTIIFNDGIKKYVSVFTYNSSFNGINVKFKSRKDADSVINNPNFRKILDTVYKN